jgi:hypothetical protein
MPIPARPRILDAALSLIQQRESDGSPPGRSLWPQARPRVARCAQLTDMRRIGSARSAIHPRFLLSPAILPASSACRLREPGVSRPWPAPPRPASSGVRARVRPAGPPLPGAVRRTRSYRGAGCCGGGIPGRQPRHEPCVAVRDPGVRPGWRRVAASGRRRRTASRCRSRDRP